MRVVLVLRAVLSRLLLLVGFVPFAISVVLLGGPLANLGIAVWLVGIVGWVCGGPSPMTSALGRIGPWFPVTQRHCSA